MIRPFLLAALLVTAVACSDTPVAAPPPLDEPELATITGTLVAPSMLRSGDEFIELAGWQVSLLDGLVGADLMVEGVPETTDGDFLMYEFSVLAVDGLPAIDGMLTAHAEGFAIYSRLGDSVVLDDIPADLEGHIGKRVWVALRDGVPERFGVLEN